jgi:hypothetical protein
MFRNNVSFYGEELLAPRPKPKVEDYPLFGCPQLLIHYIHSYAAHWRPFLHPQPEDAQYCGDRDSLIMKTHYILTKIVQCYCSVTSNKIWLSIRLHEIRAAQLQWRYLIGRLHFEFTVPLISYYPFILSYLIYYPSVSVKPFRVLIAHNIDLSSNLCA